MNATPTERDAFAGKLAVHPTKQNFFTGGRAAKLEGKASFTSVNQSIM